MPTERPAFDAELDSTNPITTGVGFASWFAEDVANPGRLTDVSGNALHGTLTNLDPDYQMVVTGGTDGNTVYNQTYSPAGSEYGKTKYLSADGLYKLSFWYMMDPEMDGYWFLWAASGSEPGMDGYASYKAGNVAANEGTYSGGFAVAQGDIAPGPWFADGILCTAGGGGHISVPNTGGALNFGTSDYTIAMRYKTAANIGLVPTALSIGTDATPAMTIGVDASRPWGGTDSFAINGGGVFPSSSSVWTVNVAKSVVITADRDGNAKLFVNGSSFAQVDYSAQSASITGTTLLIGAKHGAVPNDNWGWQGYIDGLVIWPSRLLSDADAATVSGDLFALAAADLPIIGPFPTFRNV